MSAGIRAVFASIDVEDLDKGVDFYAKGLGFVEQRRLFSGTAAEMQAGETLVYLLVKAAGTSPFPGSEEQRRYSRHWTPVHLDLVVEDIEVAVERAEAAGAIVERPITAQDNWREAQLSDPFGNGFCLLEGWPS